METAKTAKTAETALLLLSSSEYDLVIIALSRPEKSGLAVVSSAVAGATLTKVAVISGAEPTQHIGFEAGHLGASQMFEKPLNYNRVLIWVRGALKNLGSGIHTVPRPPSKSGGRPERQGHVKRTPQVSIT